MTPLPGPTYVADVPPNGNYTDCAFDPATPGLHFILRINGALPVENDNGTARVVADPPAGWVPPEYMFVHPPNAPAQ